MKRVALVLSSGGARGFAHIGAIEELQERGYEIASVAGTSMGALIGGMFAAGKLEQVKERAFALDRKRMFALADISMGPDHLVKGEKVMGILREIMPDIPIETLPVPFCAVATDLADNSEVCTKPSGPLSPFPHFSSRKGTERCSLSTAAFSIRCR